MTLKLLFYLTKMNAVRNYRLTSEKRKKASMKQAWLYTLFTALVAIIFIFVFLGSVLLSIDFVSSPGFFTMMLGQVSGCVFVCFVIMTYREFYMDDSMQLYETLPLPSSTVFIAKFFSSGYILLSIWVMLVISMVKIGINATTAPWLGCVLGIILASLWSMLVLVVAIGVSYGLSRVSFISSHSYLVTIGGGIAFALLYVTTSNNMKDIADNVISQQDVSGIQWLNGIHHALLAPTALVSWVWVAGLGCLVLIIGRVVYRVTLSALHVTPRTGAKAKVAQKQKKQQSKGTPRTTDTVSKALARVQLRKLTDANIIVNVLMAKFIYLFIMFAGIINIINSARHSTLTTDFWGGMVLVGVVVAFATMNDDSISGFIISLDGQDYNLLQALPIRIRDYLRLKFRMALAIEWLVAGIPLMVILIFVRLPLLLDLAVLVGYSVVVYSMALYVYVRDYRLLLLDWTSLNDLTQRGLSNQFFKMIFRIVPLVIVVAITALFFIMLSYLNPWQKNLVGGGVIVILGVIVTTIWHYANTKLWQKVKN